MSRIIAIMSHTRFDCRIPIFHNAHKKIDIRIVKWKPYLYQWLDHDKWEEKDPHCHMPTWCKGPSLSGHSPLSSSHCKLSYTCLRCICLQLCEPNRNKPGEASKMVASPVRWSCSSMTGPAWGDVIGTLRTIWHGGISFQMAHFPVLYHWCPLLPNCCKRWEMKFPCGTCNP